MHKVLVWGSQIQTVEINALPIPVFCCCSGISSALKSSEEDFMSWWASIKICCAFLGVAIGVCTDCEELDITGVKMLHCAVIKISALRSIRNCCTKSKGPHTRTSLLLVMKCKPILVAIFCMVCDRWSSTSQNWRVADSLHCKCKWKWRGALKKETRKKCICFALLQWCLHVYGYNKGAMIWIHSTQKTKAGGFVLCYPKPSDLNRQVNIWRAHKAMDFGLEKGPAKALSKW